MIKRTTLAWMVCLTASFTTASMVVAADGPAQVAPAVSPVQESVQNPTPPSEQPITTTNTHIQVRDMESLGFESTWEKPDILLVNMADEDVHFDFDSDVIKPEGMKRLSKLADILNRFPESTLLVYGYSDSIGTSGNKQALSQRRADHVAKALQEKGIDASRFESVKGRSDKQPIISNKKNTGRRTNRRVELRVHFKIVSDLECLGFSCAWEKPDVLDVLRVTMVDDKVRFGIGTDVIKPAGMKRLSSLAEILIRFPKSTLTVYGYSDSKGTAEEKKDISQRRADRVARVLKEKGVSAERFLSVEGRSDSQPIVKNAGKKGRGTNRRVEVQVHF